MTINCNALYLLTNFAALNIATITTDRQIWRDETVGVKDKNSSKNTSKKFIMNRKLKKRRYLYLHKNNIFLNINWYKRFSGVVNTITEAYNRDR